MIRLFLDSGRTGFYLKVVVEGSVVGGDRLERLGRDGADVTVADVWRLQTGKERDVSLLRRAVSVQALPPRPRARLLARLRELGS